MKGILYRLILTYSLNNRLCRGGQTYNQLKMIKYLKFFKCLPNTYSAGALLLSHYADWYYCSRVLQKQSKCYYDFNLQIGCDSILYCFAMGVSSSFLVLPYFFYLSLNH
jgi:hypothetical protein